jgi:two-component system, chemotaxis family, CheB/CheR fusion protein
MRTMRLRRQRPRSFTATSQSGPAAANNDPLIVAIGASAGGIEAIMELLRSLPPDTGMAFVLIQHLDPSHQSILTELVSKKTSMEVYEVTDGMGIAPNRVYVIPPNASMTISNHTLHLAARGESRGVHMLIDQFMRTLAEEHGNRAIGVILSGLGSDGTLGIAEIQAQGGVTFAQDETTAKYDGMPRSAIASGCIDYVLSPKEIAHELARISQHPYTARTTGDESFELGEDNAGLNTLFRLLLRRTGLDFTHYRQTTILRRIQRRMVVHKIDRLRAYVKFVQTNPAEIDALYQDLLINVTSFFRNPQMFAALKSLVFPGIMRARDSDASIRIWIPGCASGEETYSVAIALLEFLGDRVSDTSIQIFGTDVSETSLAKARAGVYPENVQSDLSPERLQHYFTKVETGYRISKSIRDICIFAQHNLVNDPPFSQMDLICCRNLLIYLEPVLQKKVVSLFHYATRPKGYLVLGTSESIGTATSLFTLEDRANKVFSKKLTTTRQLVTFSLRRHAERGSAPALLPAKMPDAAWNYMDLQKEFDRKLLAHYAPAAVFINEDLEIIHTRGNVSSYLKLAPGRASLSLLKMARDELILELRKAIARAKKEDGPVRKSNIVVKNGDDGTDSHSEKSRLVNFEVLSMKVGNLKELYFMILFEDAKLEPPQPKERRARESGSAARRAVKLEQELAATKEYLQSVIETQEATNEELQSANEEILSSNEEVQSTNEELETAKEELQSAYEELSTVNDELRNRNMEVTEVNNDLTNLLSSIDVAVIIVGRDLTIRRITPLAQEILGLIPSDIGRPFVNINLSIEIPDFQRTVIEVAARHHRVEKDVQDRQGARYHLRILPYRVAENKMDGAVITLAPASSAPYS